MVRFSNIIFLSGTFAFLMLMNAWPVQYSAEESGSTCYIGGDRLSFRINENKTVSDSNAMADVFEDEGLFYLNICALENCERRLTFVLRNISVSEGSYELNQPSALYVSIMSEGDACSYSTDHYYTGNLTIHQYNRAERRISGCFHFIAYAPDCDALIKVSDGKLNLRLKEDQSM